MAGPFKLFKRKRAAKPAPEPKAMASLAELFQQDSIHSPTGARLPRFQTMAGDQVDKRRDDRFASLRVKIRGAFTPSQPVADPRMFAGRRGVLEQMIRAIEDQRLHLVAYGERGIGKTSLLHTLAEAARDAKYIVVYWSCGATSNFDETFRAVAGEIPLLFHSRFSPTTFETDAGSTLADILPPTKISPRVFGDMAVKITGTRVLIILDEFDRTESGDFRREVAELIKIMSDRSVRVNVVIAGVGADLAELVEHIPSIRRNILAFQVPLMTADEIRELVDIGEKGSGVAFDAGSRDLVTSIAHGSPYLASLLCHHAALSALDAHRTRVQEGDFATGVDQAASELRDRVPRAVQQVVDRLAKRGGVRLLSLLAAASLEGSGEFDDQLIETMARTAVETAQARKLAEELANNGDLLRVRDEDGRRRYAFVEEGIPPYLWLLGARESIEEPRPAAEKRAKAL